MSFNGADDDSGQRLASESFDYKFRGKKMRITSRSLVVARVYRN